MTRRYKPASDAAFLVEADRVNDNFPSFAPALPKALEHRAYKAGLEDLREKIRAAQLVESQYHRAVAEKNHARAALARMLKRIQSGVAFHYGDDAPEVGLAGGNPVTSRKRAPRRITTPPKAA